MADRRSNTESEAQFNPQGADGANAVENLRVLTEFTDFHMPMLMTYGSRMIERGGMNEIVKDYYTPSDLQIADVDATVDENNVRNYAFGADQLKNYMQTMVKKATSRIAADQGGVSGVGSRDYHRIRIRAEMMRAIDAKMAGNFPAIKGTSNSIVNQAGSPMTYMGNRLDIDDLSDQTAIISTVDAANLTVTDFGGYIVKATGDDDEGDNSVAVGNTAFINDTTPAADRQPLTIRHIFRSLQSIYDASHGSLARAKMERSGMSGSSSGGMGVDFYVFAHSNQWENLINSARGNNKFTDLNRIQVMVNGEMTSICASFTVIKHETFGNVALVTLPQQLGKASGANHHPLIMPSGVTQVVWNHAPTVEELNAKTTIYETFCRAVYTLEPPSQTQMRVIVGTPQTGPSGSA